MKIIIKSSQDKIIMDLPYGEILKLLEILKHDTSGYSKKVIVTSNKATQEDCGFIHHLKDNYDISIECEIYRS